MTWLRYTKTWKKETGLEVVTSVIPHKNLDMITMKDAILMPEENLNV